MRKLFLILFSICFSNILTQAQVSIDGRHVFVDTLTNMFLACVPEQLFDGDTTLTVTLEQGWKQISIDGEDITTDSYTFHNINAEHVWPITLTADDGSQLQSNLQFTFLPIVQLCGTFGYDYQPATFVFACPDSIHTDTLTAQAKWRGGTTNSSNKHKRNYKVKFDDDHTFLGMRNDNNWILDAGQPDVFRLRNRIAMDLWNDMGTLPYYADQEPKARNGVSGRVVEVFLNNEYRGIYNFSENIDRKQMKLKKIDKETGEIRGCLYKGISWESTQMTDTLFTYDNTTEALRGFEVKYPDLSDNDTTDWAPLVEAINFVRMSSDDEFIAHVEEYFDVPPLVDYSLLLSVVNALDNSGKNMFWAVYDKTVDRRLTIAPWDLDCTFGQRWGGTLSTDFDGVASPLYITDVDVWVFYRLYQFNYKGFNDSLNQRYAELRQSIFATDSLIARFTNYYLAIKNSGAAARETDKWSGDIDIKGEAINFEEEYTYISKWITQHMELLDLLTFPLYYTEEFFYQQAIDSTPYVQRSTYYIYDLQGRQFSNSKLLPKGIYIKNGRKFVVK